MSTAELDTAQTEASHQSDSVPPYGWAAVAAGLIGFIYVLTLAPTTAFWDTSEYIATGHILGIPHPPGNPLFVVLARAWSVLLSPLGISTSIRINLFSALMGSLSHGLWFLVVHHVLRHFSDDRNFRLIGAMAAVLISATAFTVWNQSNVNEKVYTVSLFTIALLSWLAVRWEERQGKGGDDNLLVLMLFILALSVGNHLMAFLAAPALGLYILAVRPQTLLNPRLYGAGAIAVVLGLSIHLFLPLRSGLNPVINEAQPTCESVPSALLSVVTYGNAGCEELSAALKREQYQKPDLSLVQRQAPITSQYLNWLQYFNWQWSRSIQAEDTLFRNARLPVTVLFIFLGLVGTTEHYRRDRVSWIYLFSLFGVLSVGLVFYLDFKYGYSMPAPTAARELHEVRERDYFFIVSFSLWGLMAGLGLATLWRQLGDKLGSLKKASPILAIAVLPLFLNWGWATRSYDYSARDWAHNLLMSVEPYGVLFTNGDNDTFPLWYLQEVEGIRRDVTVIVTSYLNTDWYVKQLRDLTRPCGPGEDPLEDPTLISCQRPYDAANTDAIYTSNPNAPEAAGKTVILIPPFSAPTQSIFDLDNLTIEQVAEAYIPIEEAQAYDLGGITATMAGGQYMYPWHQFSMAVIARSIGDRPVYFASSGGAASALGLREHTVRQGLAFKLWPDDPEIPRPATIIRNDDSSPLAGVVGPWLDVPRTEELLDDVFMHREGLPDDWGHWPDPSTIGIPNYYAWAYWALYQEAERTGRLQDSEAARNRAEAWTKLGT